jgi:NAD(P)-dependent dehydrogenase (short-subunit alcohol dehydrogenase family)
MASQPKSLTGRVVAITGGARGIGRATAAALARKGARVAIGDVDPEAAERTAAELGERVSAYELDVTSRPSFARFLDRVEADLGPLDVLVNNAGIMPLGPFVEESDETAVRQIDINVHGVLFGMKEALPRMLPRRSGHVVNIASAAGKAGFPHGATYCATKHAVVGVSEAVRAETRDTGIEISVVMPALVDTELGSGLEAGRAVKKLAPEEVAEEIVATLEQPRFDVFVPRSVGGINKVLGVLPRAGREAVARFLKADRILVDVDERRRASYEQRAAECEPGSLTTATADAGTPAEDEEDRAPVEPAQAR